MFPISLPIGTFDNDPGVNISVPITSVDRVVGKMNRPFKDALSLVLTSRQNTSWLGCEVCGFVQFSRKKGF